MFKYALQRIAYLLLVFTIITFMCFTLVRMLPQPVPIDPKNPLAAQQELERREALGYNEPIPVQFGYWVKNIVTNFDWGRGVRIYPSHKVTDIFFEKLPVTMLVNLYSIIGSIPIGIALGVWAALKKNTKTDYIISTVTMVAISVPSFVYAFIVQYLLCFKLQVPWLGLPFPMQLASGTDYFSAEMIKSMIPPVLSLSFGTIAGFTRTTRAELTEVLTNDFMLLARTKGLTKAQATVRHAMRNCMVVILPSIFGSFIGILGGSLIIEGIFGIPGVGGLTLKAITGANGVDYDFFMLSTCFYTFVGLAGGLVVDISYGFIDPRIRMGSKK